MPQQTPAGWYPAPDTANELRYWDGTRWLENPPAAHQQPAPTFQPAGQFNVPPRQAETSKGFAVAALVLGIAAFLTGLVPVLGLLLALAAIALAIVALVKNQSKKMAIFGLVLGGIALLSSLVVAGGGTNSSDSGADGGTKTSDSLAAADEKTASAKPSAPASKEAEQEEAPDPAPAAGTVENPSPQPYVAKGLLGGEKYSLTAKVVNADANALVAQYNMFNGEAPAGYKYVVVELTMTGIDEDGVEPSLASVDLSLATPEGNQYDEEYIIFGDGMSSMSDGPTLYPGSSFTGYSAYIVPQSAQSFLLHDNGKYIAF